MQVYMQQNRDVTTISSPVEGSADFSMHLFSSLRSAIKAFFNLLLSFLTKKTLKFSKKIAKNYFFERIVQDKIFARNCIQQSCHNDNSDTVFGIKS